MNGLNNNTDKLQKHIYIVLRFAPCRSSVLFIGFPVHITAIDYSEVSVFCKTCQVVETHAGRHPSERRLLRDRTPVADLSDMCVSRDVFIVTTSPHRVLIDRAHAGADTRPAFHCAPGGAKLTSIAQQVGVAQSESETDSERERESSTLNCQRVALLCK